MSNGSRSQIRFLEVIVFKRGIMLAVLLAAGVIVETAAVAQNATAPKAQDNVATGEAAVKQLLPLMNQDKDGKVSKQEFMKFMEAEFDRLDKEKEGKLDVKKLTQPPSPPIRGFHK
jgi:sulfatase maturation enzyme AslB (radical SAM superfamily)